MGRHIYRLFLIHVTLNRTNEQKDAEAELNALADEGFYPIHVASGSIGGAMMILLILRKQNRLPNVDTSNMTLRQRLDLAKELLRGGGKPPMNDTSPNQTGL